MNTSEASQGSGRSRIWFSIVLPIAALGLLLAAFTFGDPLAFFQGDLPPAEALSFEPIRVVDGGFQVTLVNGGPKPVSVAQVLVDEAYWSFEIDPGPTLPRLGRADLFIPYPWVAGEPHEIQVISATGATFAASVEIAAPAPQPDAKMFFAYGLIGVYVGVIPVALGLLWFPALRRLSRRWMGALLALTVGLLVFLLFDTLLEAFELAADLPGVFQGISLTLFAALLTWLVLIAFGERRPGGNHSAGWRRGLALATLIALSIGLHNLGEGLAIGAAFALGEAALGSFLVIGFTLHNITEGIGIAAPMLRSGLQEDTRGRRGPKVGHFIGLALLAGAPAILGTWIGGFAFSPLLAVIFLGMGAGAIWQVIVEVGALLRRYAQAEGTPLLSWTNTAGFALGFLIMYLTAFLVSV